MQCPTCATMMDKGEVSIHGTPLGFLFVGISYQKLWFLCRGSKQKVLIGAWGKARAFHCPNCAATFLPGISSTPGKEEMNQVPDNSILDELAKRRS